MFDNLGVERPCPGRVRLGGGAWTETEVITGGRDEVSSPALSALSGRVEGEAGAGGGPAGTAALQAGVAHTVVTHGTLTSGCFPLGAVRC